MTTPLWKRVIVYILEGLLALVFISPLIWVVVCSFSPQPGSAQSKGWGVNNYLTLFGYQEGLPKYLFNSVVVTLVAWCSPWWCARSQAIRSPVSTIRAAISDSW